MTVAPWTDAGTAWVVDTGVFVACGRAGNQKYAGLRRFALDREMAFVIPRRVYEELGGVPSGSTPAGVPVAQAIEAGWTRLADELDYTDGTVATVMDTVQSVIAQSSQRPEDDIEKTDAALAGVAVQLLNRPGVSDVCVVTTDHDAREGVTIALNTQGLGGRATTIDGFEFVDGLF